MDPNELGYILDYPSYNAREEYQDKPRQNERGSLVEELDISKTPWVIPSDPEPEHEIVFEENDKNPYIEPLLNYLKYEYEESNTENWNVFGDPEVDSKVDIN